MSTEIKTADSYSVRRRRIRDAIRAHVNAQVALAKAGTTKQAEALREAADKAKKKMSEVVSANMG